MQGYLIGPDVPKLNEQALKNLVDDVTFIEKEVKRLEKPGLDDVFDEIKSVSRAKHPSHQEHAMFTASRPSQIINLILSEAVQAYMEPSVRQGSYAVIRPRNLQTVLEKLARYVPDPRNMTPDDAVRMTRRRREAEMVAKLVNQGR